MYCQARGWPIIIGSLIGELKPATVNSVPDYLVHIAKIESGCLKGIIAQHCLMAHLQGIYQHDHY